MAIITVDFDGTLYKGNSFNAMFHIAKKEFTWKDWFVIGQGFLKASLVGMFKGKEALKHAFFRSFAKSFKGQSKHELHSFFKVLVQARMNEMNHELIKVIRQHQSNGDEVVILSGALSPFLQAFVNELDLDVHMISTQLMFDSEDKCTGEIGTIVNGEEKVNKIADWLDKNSLVVERSGRSGDLWAYADSESDLPLLEYVLHPVIVNPNKFMKRIAAKNQWTIF